MLCFRLPGLSGTLNAKRKSPRLRVETSCQEGRIDEFTGEYHTTFIMSHMMFFNVSPSTLFIRELFTPRVGEQWLHTFAACGPGLLLAVNSLHEQTIRFCHNDSVRRKRIAHWVAVTYNNVFKNLTTHDCLDRKKLSTSQLSRVWLTNDTNDIHLFRVGLRRQHASFRPNIRVVKRG